MKGESRKLPAIAGTFGPFSIAGNSLPEITYLVFDDKLMEFVTVSVYLALPNKIAFHAVTPDLGDVLCKPAYQAPFFRLAKQLYRYWPLHTESKVTNVIF